MEQTDSHTPSATGQEPVLQSSNRLPAAQRPAASPPAELDAHGFDPALYDWVPVRKKRRHDGWSNEKQRKFIELLADSGSVTAAADAVGMSRDSCYALRRSPGAENFARAWEAAIAAASRRLIDIAFDRAINGVEEPVFNKEGQRIACRYRYNDRLLMFLIRAHAPEQYRHAHCDERTSAEVPPSPAPAVADALRLLEPAMPAEPHLLMEPDALDTALLCADILDGELPGYRRDPDPQAAFTRTAADEKIDQMLDAARKENAKFERRRRAWS